MEKTKSEEEEKMKLYIIDELVLKNFRGIKIEAVEIPDEVLLKFRTAFELWKKEKEEKTGDNGKSKI